MAQEDDKKQNPTVQHYVVCKTQQKNIMFFCKPQQKNIAKPNRKALCFLKINRVHQMSLSVAWWKKQNNKSGTFLIVGASSLFDRIVVGLQITVCCVGCKNKNVFFVLIQKQKCLMQQQKCILCFDTTTKMYIQQLMAQSKQQLTSNNILFFEIQTTYKYMMCVSTPINVFWGLLRIFLKAFWRPFRGLWKAF